MVRLSIASTAAVVALALAPSSALAVPSRALLAETAPAPASAPAVVKPSASSSDMTLASDGVIFADGKLIIKDPAESIIKRNGEAFGLASTAATFGPGSKVNAAGDAVILGVGADGAPLTALARLSNPILGDDKLTFDAVILKKPAGPPKAGSAVEATAEKAASLVAPDAKSFKADTAAIVFDGQDAPAPAGDKSIIGAAVGAGVGTAVCGPWCGAGGAMAGAWWF